MAKVIGVVPGRMGSSRFPGKPLEPILGRPLIEHCYLRACMFMGFDELIVATPSREIEDFCERRGWPCFCTPKSEEGRALDCVAEATSWCDDDDIIVCVQGDEPMVTPENIGVIVDHVAQKRSNVAALIVALRDGDLDDTNVVKALMDGDQNLLYTTRQPVPAADGRIGGLLAWCSGALKRFALMAPNKHETGESCDINRYLGHGYRARGVHAVSPSYQSVDCPADIKVVEQLLPSDELWGQY